MPNNRQLQAVAKFISNELEQEGDQGLELAETTNLRHLRLALIERIGYLPQHNRALLKSILYRVEVDEERLNEKLNAAGSQEGEAIIADLIIEPQRQKLKTGQHYRSGGDGEWKFDRKE